MSPRFYLPLLFAALVALSAGSPPVLDEESYLDIAHQIAAHPARPYDWFRPWQPWGATPPPDAYLFAHPPLHLWWLSLWSGATGPALRLAAALPWALLLGWALGALAERFTRRPHAAALALLASPALLVASQAGLMIDLDTLALSCAALALWTRPGRAAALGAGLLAGLAAETKYPALLLSAAILIDATLGINKSDKDARARLGIFATTFGAVFFSLELFLATVYGRIHLIEVLREAGQIGRGPLAGRALGLLSRVGLCLPPLLLFGADRRLLLPALLGAALVALGLQGTLEPGLLALSAALGGAGAALLTRGLRQGPRLLRLWAGLSLLGVLFAHNYVGGRYLLPALVPLTLLLVEQAGARARLAGLWLPVALGAAVAERAYAAAADEVARQLAAASPTPGWFTGEWTFRYRMEQQGWRFWSPEQTLPPGALLAVPLNASPAAPPPGWTPTTHVQASIRWPLRLIDLEQGVGYHAETLGPAPIGWSLGPMEQASLGTVP